MEVESLRKGPTQGLLTLKEMHTSKLNIGINRNNNYMSLFLSYFIPPETGVYQFCCTDKDDRATIWFDLDRDGTFLWLVAKKWAAIIISPSGSHYLEADANEKYMIAIAHGE